MTELKTIKFQLMLAQSEADAIDDWSFKNRIRTRAEAIRRLCQIGLAVDAKMEEIFHQNLDILGANVDLLKAMGREVMDEEGNKKEYIPPRNDVEKAADELRFRTSKLYDIIKEFHDVAWLAKSPIKTEEIHDLIAENEKLYDRILARKGDEPASE
jgi:hypothetical protein